MYETVVWWGAPYVAISIIFGFGIYGIDRQITHDVRELFFYWQCFLLGFLWPIAFVSMPFIPFIAFFVSLRSYLRLRKTKCPVDEDDERLGNA
jgi:hypothetical protein